MGIGLREPPALAAGLLRNDIRVIPAASGIGSQEDDPRDKNHG